MSAQRVVYLVEFASMFGVWLAVAVTYHVLSGGAWRRSPEGRHVMVFALIFVWNTALVITTLILGNYPGRFVIGTASYALFAIVGAQRLVMIVRAQREKRRLQGLRARSAASRTAAEPPR